MKAIEYEGEAISRIEFFSFFQDNAEPPSRPKQPAKEGDGGEISPGED